MIPVIVWLHVMVWQKIEGLLSFLKRKILIRFVKLAKIYTDKNLIQLKRLKTVLQTVSFTKELLLLHLTQTQSQLSGNQKTETTIIF